MEMGWIDWMASLSCWLVDDGSFASASTFACRLAHKIKVCSALCHHQKACTSRCRQNAKNHSKPIRTRIFKKENFLKKCKDCNDQTNNAFDITRINLTVVH